MAPVVHPHIGWDVDVVRDQDGTVWERNGDGTWRTADGRHESTSSELAASGPLSDLTSTVDWQLGFGGAA